MKRTALILLVISILAVNVAADAQLKDVKADAWYYENLVRLIELKAVSGYPDGTFKPNDSIQVDQFVKILLTATGNKQENAKDYWATNYIGKAKELGFIKSNEFDRYTRPITRGEIARVLVRALPEGKRNVRSTKVIIDLGETPLSLRNYVSVAFGNGLITGYPSGAFGYGNQATRAEAISMICRLVDILQ